MSILARLSVTLLVSFIYAYLYNWLLCLVISYGYGYSYSCNYDMVMVMVMVKVMVMGMIMVIVIFMVIAMNAFDSSCKYSRMYKCQRYLDFRAHYWYPLSMNIYIIES